MTQPGAPVSESANPPTGAPSVPLIELNGLTVRFGNRDILRNFASACVSKRTENPLRLR